MRPRPLGYFGVESPVSCQVEAKLNGTFESPESAVNYPALLVAFGDS
ncbi:MAG: hypothetical protein ACI9PP_001726, partial [Halobacteriales archaeon]